MHKEFYEKYDQVALVCGDTEEERDDEADTKVGLLQGEKPPCLILSISKFTEVDIHGDTKYLAAVYYRRRMIT